jgi:hypothetical protein
MFDEEMSGAVDLEKSKTLFTLKSVETRDGAEFGKIEGMMELSLGQMGPMKLETPILFKVSLTADACIDGKLPDGVLVMKAEMKGKSAAAGPSGKIELDLDMTATGKKTAKTAK